MKLMKSGIHRGPKKKSKKRRWSKVPRPTIIKRQYFHLPTRETLTYAEAQNLVDIDIDGRLHRLNIGHPLQIMTSSEFEKLEKLEDMKTSAMFVEDSCSMSATTLAKLPQLAFQVVSEPVTARGILKQQAAYYRTTEQTPEELDEEVEYDIDEEDLAWLKLVNEERRNEKLVCLSQDDFETVVDRLDKESFIVSVAGEPDSTKPCRFFFVLTGAYKRSFCGLVGTATVKTFSSVNQMKFTIAVG